MGKQNQFQEMRPNNKLTLSVGRQLNYLMPGLADKKQTPRQVELAKENRIKELLKDAYGLEKSIPGADTRAKRETAQALRELGYTGEIGLKY